MARLPAGSKAEEVFWAAGFVFTTMRINWGQSVLYTTRPQIPRGKYPATIAGIFRLRRLSRRNPPGGQSWGGRSYFLSKLIFLGMWGLVWRCFRSWLFGLSVRCGREPRRSSRIR